MRRGRYSEEEILGILRDGERVEDLRAFCEAQNITERMYRAWLASRSDAAVDSGGSPSRSQRTRESKAINRLGLRLVALSPLEFDRIELSPDLRSAVEACRTLKKGALVRQKRRVCKLLRSEDHESIRAQVESL